MSDTFCAISNDELATVTGAGMAERMKMIGKYAVIGGLYGLPAGAAAGAAVGSLAGGIGALPGAAIGAGVGVGWGAFLGAFAGARLPESGTL